MEPAVENFNIADDEKPDQDLGWRSNHRYLPQKPDISSVTYWYQAESHASFPKLPSANELEVN